MLNLSDDKRLLQKDQKKRYPQLLLLIGHLEHQLQTSILIRPLVLRIHSEYVEKEVYHGLDHSSFLSTTHQDLENGLEVSIDYLLGCTDTSALTPQEKDENAFQTFVHDPKLNLYYKELPDPEEEAVRKLYDLRLSIILSWINSYIIVHLK